MTDAQRAALSEQFDKASRLAGAEPVAVVGIGCRFPGGVVGPQGYWEFLASGGDAIGEVPSDRWDAEAFYDPDPFAPGRMASKWGGFLPDVSGFDADFFGISPREAETMDPQQRVLLEVAWEALEHAGIAPDRMGGSRTGVMMGVYYTEYQSNSAANPDTIDAYCATGNAHSITVGRIAYLLGLRGPAVAVDTACSSSLVAVHLACQSLRMRESDLVLAGGVNCILRPETQLALSKWGMLSPRGRCHAFDAGADGFVRGEGAGVVVLKRLTDAVCDGDRVLAVVRGSAVNQDGRSNGLTAPNALAQRDVITRALRGADVAAGSVNFIEAHGTGTALGDPIEFDALAATYGRGDGPCALGAVKTNMGHLEGAAGIAGFIKAALSVHRGQIPPNLNFTQWNPAIDASATRMFVPTDLAPWPDCPGPRRAAVSSFGLGGTNAHVVLEQGPDPLPASDGPSDSSVSTLVVSGRTTERVGSWASVLADWMENDNAGVKLADVAHTLVHRRAHHGKSATVCAVDRAQAIAGLRALAAGVPAPGVVLPRETPAGSGTVFVYSGQGSQWAGMGRQLLADEPAFAAAVAELEPVFVEQVGFSLRGVLDAGEPVVGIDRIQPVLVGMHVALTELWRSYGVQPDAVIGHSMGEVSAAVVAGALSPAEGLRVIATRSRLMSRLSGQGAMALLELDASATEELIAGYPDVTLAVYASPRQTVVAGPPAQVDAVIAVVDAQGRLARRIEVDVASHHPTIDPILPELHTALADLAPYPPTIPILTTTQDDSVTGITVFDADHWVANLRNPVRFGHAVAAAGDNHSTFVEISPHPLLTHAITESLEPLHHHSIGTLQRDASETLTFHTNLNATHTVHSPQTEHPPEPHPALPATPWHHTQHWIGLKRKVDAAGVAPRPGTLLGEHIAVAAASPVHLWQARLVSEAKPYPGGHRIHGVEVVPISVLLQTLSAAAAKSGASRLCDIRFDHPIVIDHPLIIQVVADGESVTVSSRSAADAAEHRWVRHVSAGIAHRTADDEAEDADTTGEHEMVDYDTSSVAELQRAWGIDGQPFPWSIGSCRSGPGRLDVDVSLPEASTVGLLDAAVHVARLVDSSDPRLMVPAALGSVWLADGLAEAHGCVEVRRCGGNGDELIVDIVVKTADGRPCIEIRALRYADVQSAPVQAARDADPLTFVHAIEWQPWRGHAEPQQPPDSVCDVAVLGQSDAASTLRARLSDAGYRAAGVDDARCVVYVAEAGPEHSGESDLDCSVRLSGEVTDLVRRLAKRDDRHNPRLWIITRGVGDAVSDTALRESCLWGLAGVIGAEQPQLWGGLVDIPACDDIGDCASALSALLPTAAKSILMLRDGEFFAPALVPVAGQPVREPLRCRPDAAYLITGGLGALGLLMADWLADRGARRLVLVGRTPLPARRDWDNDTNDADVRHKIAAIRALEMRGVSIDAVALDVGSRDGVRALLAKRDGEGAPPIRGVIHAAGITEGQLLTEIADSQLRRTMWPKIAGAQALHEAFPPAALDFFFLTASAGTVFGIPGQGAYAAANAYLDCLARARHRQGCHTVSLDWAAWQGLGFGADAHVVVQELQRFGSRPVTPQEAFTAWEYVHRYDVERAVMAPLPSAEEGAPVIADAHQTSTPSRAWSQMSPDDLHAELENGLRSILATELRIPEADLQFDRPFAELGLDSVMAMSIRREAEQLIGMELSATMLWNHPTVASLANFLAEKLLPPKDSEADVAVTPDASSNVLEALFDSVESARAGSGGGA